MDSDFKIKQNIREAKSVLQMPEYDDVVEALIRKLHSHAISIVFYDKNYSTSRSTLSEISGNYIYTILIKRKPVFGDNKEVIFDIMHEMGHCLDPIKLPPEDRDNKQLREAREVRAWAIAGEVFSSFPELQPALEEYNSYKAHCLLSYGL